MSIRIGILGYGNLGRGVECAIKQNDDMELVAVFTRRNPQDLSILTCLLYTSSLPLDGIVIVTSPQELVSMIVGKAVNMAKKMDIPIIGIVENMSYVKCPDCDKKIYVFGKSHLEEVDVYERQDHGQIEKLLIFI